MAHERVLRLDVGVVHAGADDVGVIAEGMSGLGDDAVDVVQGAAAAEDVVLGDEGAPGFNVFDSASIIAQSVK